MESYFKFSDRIIVTHRRSHRQWKGSLIYSSIIIPLSNSYTKTNYLLTTKNRSSTTLPSCFLTFSNLHHRSSITSLMVHDVRRCCRQEAHRGKRNQRGAKELSGNFHANPSPRGLAVSGTRSGRRVRTRWWGLCRRYRRAQKARKRPAVIRLAACDRR